MPSFCYDGIMKKQIFKSAGIIIEGEKLLVSKSKNKEHFISPGGKIEKGETARQALVRELKEELDINVSENDLEEFGKFSAPASGAEDIELVMEVFVVKKYSGKIVPSGEIEKIMWLGKEIPTGIKIGSIFEHEVMPRLIKLGKIK